MVPLHHCHSLIRWKNITIKFMLNKYSTYARFFPAVLSLIPISLLSHFYLYEKIPKLIDSIILTKIAGDFSVLLIFVYFVMQTSRYVSKKYFQGNYFKNESHFPTTNYLLCSDATYSEDYKQKIKNKVATDFSMTFLDEFSEKMDEESARKKIVEAVNMIRSKVKNGRLLLQHNIEYGFVRNLLGGLAISIPISVFNVVLFMFLENIIALVLSCVLLLIFLTLFWFSEDILIYFAHNYAKVLFNEFLSDEM